MNIANMTLAWFCLEISVNIFDGAYFTFLGTNSHSRYSWLTKKRLLLVWCAFTTLLTLFLFVVDFKIITLYLVILPVITYSFLGNNRPQPQALLHGISIYLFRTIGFFLAMTLVIIWQNASFEDILSPSTARLLVLIITKAIQTIIWIYLRHYTQKVFSDSQLVKHYATISIFAVITFFGLILILNKHILNVIPHHFLILTALLFILFTYLTIHNLSMFDNISADDDAKYLQALSKQKQGDRDNLHRMLTHTNLLIVDSVTMATSLREDLGKMLQVNNENNIEEALTKLNDVYELCHHMIETMPETGDDLIDSLLLVKAYHLAKANTSIETTGRINDDCRVKRSDLASLVFCLLKIADNELDTLPITETKQVFLNFNHTKHLLEISVAYTAAKRLYLVPHDLLVNINFTLNKYHSSTIEQTKQEPLATIKISIPQKRPFFSF